MNVHTPITANDAGSVTIQDRNGHHIHAGPDGENFFISSGRVAGNNFTRDGLLELAAELTKLAGPARTNNPLTAAETLVLRHLVAGLANKEIARRLSLSHRAVETHRLNLRRKTQTGRLHELMRLARDLGLEAVS